jgi:hypothetical protein
MSTGKIGLLLTLLVACDQRESIPRTYAPAEPVAPHKSRSVQAAEDFGLSDVRREGVAGAWACSKDDSWLNSATVSGVTMAGKRVTATVCCGWLKGCTVRFQ